MTPTDSKLWFYPCRLHLTIRELSMGEKEAILNQRKREKQSALHKH